MDSASEEDIITSKSKNCSPDSEDENCDNGKELGGAIDMSDIANDELINEDERESQEQEFAGRNENMKMRLKRKKFFRLMVIRRLMVTETETTRWHRRAPLMSTSVGRRRRHSRRSLVRRRRLFSLSIRVYQISSDLVVVFDIEFTTPDRRFVSISQIGVVFAVRDPSSTGKLIQLPEKFNEYISADHAEKDCNKASMAACKITWDMIKDKPTFPVTIAKLFALFSSLLTKHNKLVGKF